MRLALYAIACVLIPAAWGVVMYRLFGYFERRRLRNVDEPRRELPPSDYSI